MVRVGRSFSRRPLQARERALLKTALYRVMMVAVSITVAWLVVGDVSDALSIGIATNLVKTATYYCYERVWDRVSWGVFAE
ncbi:DUF2061 domain-containing protein [Halomarina pelagica]|uniref:DUF2061 domain-containing protein n=1 Tax=Halomarina pelagica TaxID=2961599 RepID=UPI0020C33816|nr:DUF2061 domain-containing protein [Halomarina sp. BND7]